jgi:hypothetical protein
MASLQENRTLQILNAAAAGKYGVLAAIAYASFFPIPCPDVPLNQQNVHLATLA